MGRPTDWQPLADSDPVPGDPAGISSEAAHLSGVAQMIQGQVAQLHKIASGQADERGCHAEKLKSAASDTAGQLARVVGRYQKTAAALTAWVPDLEYAQSQSLKALAAAQDAAGRQRSSQPVSRPPGTKLTPQDKQDDQARSKALAQANDDLAAARKMLQDATSYRDQKAGETKGKIDSAIHDGLKDSFWDDVGGFFSDAWGSFSHWVTEHAKIIAQIANDQPGPARGLDGEPVRRDRRDAAVAAVTDMTPAGGGALMSEHEPEHVFDQTQIGKGLKPLAQHGYVVIGQGTLTLLARTGR